MEDFDPSEYAIGDDVTVEKKSKKKKLEKGSFMDQVHDVASAGTAMADLVTSIPGMVGGAINTMTRIGPDQQRMSAQRETRPGRALLEDIGRGGHATSFSNLTGIEEDSVDRPGYRAVMKPVEAVMKGLGMVGQGYGNVAAAAADKGLLGSERTGAAEAIGSEVSGGTEVAGLVGLPFLRGKPTKPGSQKAYQEIMDKKPSTEEAILSWAARETYSKPDELNVFDPKEYAIRPPEEFAPPINDTSLPWEPPQKPYNELQEGVPPRMEAFPEPFPPAPKAPDLSLEPGNITATDPVVGKRDRPVYGFDENLQRDRSNEGRFADVQPLGPDELQRGPREAPLPPEVIPYKPHLRGPAADVLRTPDALDANKEGIVKRAQDFEFTGTYEVTYNGKDFKFFRDPENGNWYLDPSMTGKHFTENFLGFNKKEAIEAIRTKAGLEPNKNANPRGWEKAEPPAPQRLPDANALEFWNDGLSNRLAKDDFAYKNNARTTVNPVRSGLQHIQNTSESPFYRQIAKKLLEDGSFKPDFELVERNDPRMKNKGVVSWKNMYSPARYSTHEHKIYVRKGLQGSEQLLIHEAVHARTFAALQSYIFKLAGHEGSWRHMAHLEAPVKRLFELYEGLEKRMINGELQHLKDKYGMTDIHEFVAEGFSNPAFQAELAQLKLPPELGVRSIRYYWDAFIDSISQMMGLDRKGGTYLSELLRSGSELMSGLKADNRIFYADMLDIAKDLNAPPLKELKRKGAVEALAKEAREMSLDDRPIQDVVESATSKGKIEDFTAEHTNKIWQVVARLGSAVKENMLIDTSIRQVMKDKPGSGEFIKWGIDQVARIERDAIKNTKAAIETGLTDLRKMYHSKEGRPQLLEMWDKWQKNIGVRDLTKADFATDKQWEVYSKMRAVDDAILDRVNDMREKSGLERINRIPSHFRGMWEGDYRVFVYDGAGNKKAAYGFDSEWAAGKVAKELQKRHPELTVGKVEHVKTDQYGIRNLQGFEDAIRIMSEKNDPVAKALQATYHDILQHRGFGRTGVHRTGVAGFMGSEGGLLGLRRMEHAFEQHINQAYRYIGNLEKQLVLAELNKVPKELWDQMPETKQFLESYIRKAQGAKMARDNPLDAVVTRLSKALGFGEHGPQAALRNVSALAMMYWLTTPRFLISQSVQSLNAIPKLVQKFGAIDAYSAYFNGVKNAISPDATAKEAVKWATERGYLDATIRNLVDKGLSEAPVGAGFFEVGKEVSSWMAAEIERKAVRAPVFLAFEHALRPFIKDKAARFEEAAGFADYYMVNYGRTHAPMMYDKMGTVLGESTRPLKQYAHNTWGQFFEYARGLKNRGEMAPVAHFLGVQASVAGLKGMMLVAEATAIVTLLNYMFDLDIPTPEQLMLKHGVHDALIYGGLSTVLHHDISSSVSAPGIPQMFSAAPFEMTFKMTRDVGTYIKRLAQGQDTDQDRLRAAMAISPNILHEWLKAMYTQPGQPTANPWDPNLRGNYRRSEAEDAWATYVFATKPLNEAKADAMMRAVKQELKRDMMQKQNALDAMADRVINGRGIDSSLVEKYIEQGGDPKRLSQSLRNKIKERFQTGPERMMDIRRMTPSQAHKLDVLQDYLDEINRTIPEGFRFDPETGHIRPISFDEYEDRSGYKRSKTWVKNSKPGEVELFSDSDTGRDRWLKNLPGQKENRGNVDPRMAKGPRDPQNWNRLRDSMRPQLDPSIVHDPGSPETVKQRRKQKYRM